MLLDLNPLLDVVGLGGKQRLSDGLHRPVKEIDPAADERGRLQAPVFQMALMLADVLAALGAKPVARGPTIEVPTEAPKGPSVKVKECLNVVGDEVPTPWQHNPDNPPPKGPASPPPADPPGGPANPPNPPEPPGSPAAPGGAPKTPAQALADHANANGLNGLRTSGRPGTDPNIRELPGTGADARSFFDSITKGGTVKTDTPKITVVEMPDGTFVTFRPAGKVPNKTTGVAPPTIDINIPGQDHLKLKMLP